MVQRPIPLGLWCGAWDPAPLDCLTLVTSPCKLQGSGGKPRFCFPPRTVVLSAEVGYGYCPSAFEGAFNTSCHSVALDSLQWYLSLAIGGTTRCLVPGAWILRLGRCSPVGSTLGALPGNSMLCHRASPLFVLRALRVELHQHGGSRTRSILSPVRPCV